MKPFDLTKLRKSISKSIPGISQGFNDPKTWLSTGCYALNYLISGRFEGGIPLEGKFTMIAGDSGSGKSYIASANIVKDCQAKGILPILIDTENALDESWLLDLEVDTSDGKLLMLKAAKIDDLARIFSDFVEAYKAQYATTPYGERQKVLFIVDSLGMLITENAEKQFDEGDQKGDMGLKAKQLTTTLRVFLAKVASQPIGLLATNHTMVSMDKYSPDPIPGGRMLEFASSVIVQMNKYLLKEDENGKALVGGAVAGIRSTAVVRKSRYSKPFERIKIDIPYVKGMNPYSGIHDLFIGKGVISKDGNRWTYASPITGEVFTEFKKHYQAKGLYDLIMSEWAHWEALDNTPVGVGDMDEEDITDEASE
jgi:RecA/RadA recombinase